MTIQLPPHGARVIDCGRGYFAIVDVADFDALSHFRWRAARCGSGVYRPIRQYPDQGGVRTEFLYRRILCAERGQIVDHINGDVWDNRRSNLRFATVTQNSRNRAPNRTRRSTPFKGVSKTASGRFTASIRLGTFDTAEDAARIYDKFAKLVDADFARLNFTHEEEK